VEPVLNGCVDTDLSVSWAWIIDLWSSLELCDGIGRTRVCFREEQNGGFSGPQETQKYVAPLV